MNAINIKTIVYQCTAILLGLGLWCSCADDKGNYDYKSINEVTISGIEAGKWYTKTAFVNNLTFDPQIVSSEGKNAETDYEYEWKLIPRDADIKEIEDVSKLTISRERKLDIPVTLDPGDYSGFFIVKDKESGVSWSTGFYLRVKSMTSEGWLILCEQNGKSRMDIIFNENAETDLIAHNIWKEETFDPGTPTRLFYTYSMRETLTLLVTDKNTFVLDEKDLHVGEDNELKWRFGLVPDDGIRVTASIAPLQAVKNIWVIIDDKNEAYSNDLQTSGSVFDFPINKEEGKTEFVPAPFLGTCYDKSLTNNRYGSAPAVMYDATNQRFMVIKNTSSYPSVLQFTNHSKFNPESTVGREMVHMESTTQGIIYAFLRDTSTKKLYFYGMELKAKVTYPENWWEEPTTEETCEQRYYGEVLGEGAAQATAFACHPLYPYVFYVYNNAIWQFDMRYPKEPARQVLQFPGEEIKVIKINPFIAAEKYEEWENERGYWLTIGTNKTGVDEDSCGIMRQYNVPDLMKPLEKKKEFTNLGKIVDIVYKERAK